MKNQPRQFEEFTFNGIPHKVPIPIKNPKECKHEWYGGYAFDMMKVPTPPFIHCSGTTIEVTGTSSHVEGFDSVAYGQASHVEGYNPYIKHDLTPKILKNKEILKESYEMNWMDKLINRFFKHKEE